MLYNPTWVAYPILKGIFMRNFGQIRVPFLILENPKVFKVAPH